MKETSETLSPQTLLAIPNATSSQGSEDGALLSGLQDGRMIDLCGQEAAPASLSARPANVEVMPTKDTYGQSSIGSSLSVDLQYALESRLRARLEGIGCDQYVLTWKHWDIGAQPPICALRASARRTLGKGFGGYPTPTAIQKNGGPSLSKNGGTGARRRWLQIFTPQEVNGPLNPDLFLWLMGYPIEWKNCMP